MARKSVFRYLQDIVDNTKDFVDDVIDRAHDAVRDEEADVTELKRSVAALNAKLDDLMAKQGARGAP